MSLIILNGATYTAIASDHISYINKEYSHDEGGECFFWDGDGNCVSYAPTYPVYNYPTRYTNATINGVLNVNTNTVFVEGKVPIATNHRGVESDSFTLPSTATNNGNGHTNVNSNSLEGNSKNVYVNGNLIMTDSNRVNTHVNGVSAIPSGSLSSTVRIG